MTFGWPNLRHGLDFTAEPLKDYLAFFRRVFQGIQELFRSDFEGDIPIQVELVRSIDFAHAAFADELQDDPLVVEHIAWL